MLPQKQECVKVAIRSRPLSNQEMQDQRQVIVSMNPNKGEVSIRNPKPDCLEPEKSFIYDLVFDWKQSQEYVYQNTAYPIVESVLEGYNGTIFAYGQTGTGKTFTMEGYPDPAELRGIIPRTFEHVFNTIQGTPDKSFLVSASFLELYNEEVRDLLAKNYKNKLELRENPESGVYVKDLSNHIVQNTIEMQERLAHGRKSRHVGETKMNRESSRSHSIFTIIVETCQIIEGESRIRVGKLNLVDLAGSERQSKTGAQGERFKEAISINLSLTSLGNVITNLVDPNSNFVPYRDSKLTRLLQDSLGGNTKTVMVANIGPADYNFDETMSTLRYASRAKSIKNKPKINEDPKDAMIRQYQEEIQALKDQLKQKGIGESAGQKIVEVEKVIKVQDEEKLKEIEQKLKREKDEILQEIEKQKHYIEKQKNLAFEEKQRLMQELQVKEKQQEEITYHQQGIIQKIKDMEEKLLQGDQLKQQALQQEKELQKARVELMEKEQQERRIQEELAIKEATQLDAEQKYTSIKEEIELKTKKLNTLIEKIEQTKQQKNEIESYRSREKEILMEENRSIFRELKLMDLIIEHFIPPSEVEMLKKKLEFSEEADEWIISQTQKSQRVVKQESAYNLKHPMCEFARMAINFGDLNPRFKYDNIMTIELDLPERTTEDFDGNISQKLQETINIALNDDEEELQILQQELKPNVYIPNPDEFAKESKDKQNGQNASLRASSAKKKSVRPQSGLKKAYQMELNVGNDYSKSKGQVKR